MCKFATVVKPDEDSIKTAKDIQKYLFNNGLSYSESNPDIVCVIGDNSTLTTAVHRYIRRLDQMEFVLLPKYDEELLNRIITQTGNIEEIRLLRITLKGNPSRVYLALNETTVYNETVCDYEIIIDGRSLGYGQGKGIAIATSYSQRLNAAVDKTLEAIQLNVVENTKGNYLPVVLNGNRCLTIKSDFSQSTLNFDGYHLALNNTEEIEFTLGVQALRLAHYENRENNQNLYEPW